MRRLMFVSASPCFRLLVLAFVACLFVYPALCPSGHVFGCVTLVLPALNGSVEPFLRRCLVVRYWRIACSEYSLILSNIPCPVFSGWRGKVAIVPNIARRGSAVDATEVLGSNATVFMLEFNTENHQSHHAKRDGSSTLSFISAFKTALRPLEVPLQYATTPGAHSTRAPPPILARKTRSRTKCKAQSHG